MEATLKNHHQSLRKTKLVADLVRGKKVIDVQNILTYTDKKAAEAFKKLINSAAANARAKGIALEDLFIKEVMVNKGVEFQRYMPQARGRANAITRGRSHIRVVLGTKQASKKVGKKRASKKADK